MATKDRIKSLRRVRAGDLRPNPKNWRLHSREQQDALQGILSEVGWADAVLARETADGLEIVDGHLRAEISPDEKIPVLILDIDEVEADKILATHDSIGAMATADVEKLADLVEGIEIGSVAIVAMLDGMTKSDNQTDSGSGDITTDESMLFQIIIECKNEDHQVELLDRFEEEGIKCRALIS